MYTILISSDNSLTTTVKEVIMQRSSLIDNLHFLVEPLYKEHDMTDYTVVLEYLLPISKIYKTIVLEKSDELYKDHLEYKIPLGSDITKEAGSIELTLSFINVEMNEEGEKIRRVRKTKTGLLEITPVTKWADIIPDEALSAVDERIAELVSITKGLDSLAQETYSNKADNIVLDDDGLSLTACGNKIGTTLNMDEFTDKLTKESINSNKTGLVTTIEF